MPASTTSVTTKVIGLVQNLTDPNTGAPVTFFTISQYTIKLNDGSGSQCVLQGYVSQSAKEEGKRPISHVAVDLTTRPEGDTEQWLYAAVVAKAGHDLFEAAAVYAAAE